MRVLDCVENRLNGFGGSRNCFDDRRAARYAEGIEIGRTGGGEVVVARAPLLSARFAIGKLQAGSQAQRKMRLRIGPELGIQKAIAQAVGAVAVEADHGLPVERILRAHDRCR